MSTNNLAHKFRPEGTNPVWYNLVRLQDMKLYATSGIGNCRCACYAVIKQLSGIVRNLRLCHINGRKLPIERPMTSFTTRFAVPILTVFLVLGFNMPTNAQVPVISIFSGPTTTENLLFQDGPSATFTFKLTSAFTVDTRVAIRYIQKNTPSEFPGTAVTNYLVPMNKLTHSVSLTFGTFKIMEVMMWGNDRDPGKYRFDGSVAPLIVVKSATTSPGVTIATNTESIFEGENANFTVSLSAVPGREVAHRVRFSWDTVGLIRRIGTANVVSVSDYIASVDFGQAATAQTDSDALRIITDAKILNGSDETVTVELIQEDPIDPPSEDPPGSKESPVYDPVYHHLHSSVSITVKDQNIIGTWRDGFTGTRFLRKNTFSFQGRETIDFTVTKLPTTNITFEIEYSKPNADTLYSGELTLDQFGQPTGAELIFDHWNFGTLSNPTFPAFFDPRYGTPKIIQTDARALARGETITTTLIAKLEVEDEPIQTNRYPLVLRIPELTFAFDDGMDTKTITSDNSGNYADLTATWTTSNVEDIDEYEDIVMCDDATCSLSFDDAWVQVGRFKADGRAPVTTPITIDNEDAYPVSGEFQYGTWYYTLVSQKLIFRPNAAAIDNLPAGEEGEKELTTTAYFPGTIARETITINLVGNGPPTEPEVTISAENEEIVEGEVAVFNLMGTSDAYSKLEIKYEIRDLQDFIPAAAESPKAEIETGRRTGKLEFMTEDDDLDEHDGSLRVELMDGDGYTLGETTVVTVFVEDNDTPQITITFLNNSETEGGSAKFQLANAIVVPSNLEIGISVEQMGDFILWRVPKTVIFQRGSISENFEILTADDSVPETDGSVTVSLQESASGAYRLSEDAEMRSATVDIEDNDLDTDGGNDQPGERQAIAGVVLDSILRESSLQSSNIDSSPAISNLPVVSLVAVASIINEGEVAIFTISATGTVPVKVDFEIDVTGDIASHHSQDSVYLTAENRSREIRLPTIDDDRAEPDGTITLRLMEGNGYVLAQNIQQFSTVTVSDAADRRRRQSTLSDATGSILPELTWLLGLTSFEAFSFRTDPDFVQSGGSSIELLGGRTLPETIIAGGEALNDDGLDVNTLLSNSSFVMELPSDELSSETSTIWGIGDHWDLQGSGTGSFQTWEGSLATGHIGFDSTIGESGLIGLAASFNESKYEYDLGSELSLNYKIASTGINPYLALSSPDGNSEVRLTAGYEPGWIWIDEPEYETEKVETVFQMIGVAIDKQVMVGNSNQESNRTKVKFSGMTWYAHQVIGESSPYVVPLQSEAGQVRLTTRASRKWALGRGMNLGQSASLGLAGAKFRSQTKFGMEMETGLTFASPIGLNVSGMGQMLVTGTNEILKKRVESGIGFDSNNDGLGLEVELKPSWSTGRGSLSDFNQNGGIQRIGGSSWASESGFQYESEIGYGIEMGDGAGYLRPHGSAVLNGYGVVVYELGGKYELGKKLKLELTGAETRNSAGLLGQKIRLKGNFRW